MSERFFSVRVGLHDPAELADAVIDTASFVAERARSRGIAPQRVLTIQTKEFEFDLAVIGPRDEREGWDADGAPTCEWPRRSLPWISGVESSR